MWTRFQEVNGDYGRIDVKVVKKKKTSRKRKGLRRRVFIKDVRDDICRGNQRRADSMTKSLKAKGAKYFLTHPDMSSDDTNAEQVYALEKYKEESVRKT